MYRQCHLFLCPIPMPETSLSLQIFIFKHIQAICLFLSISAIVISLFWILKPGSSCKAIIALFLNWQLLSVVHSVFLSNLFPPKLFPSYCTSYFIFGACELFLPKVTYKAFFSNWTYTLSLSGIQRYSFFLFVYS